MAKIKYPNWKNKDYISRQELAMITGVRVTTIKYYVENGLLEFIQDGEGYMRKYPKEATLKRLKEISRLKKKRLTIQEIKKELGVK